MTPEDKHNKAVWWLLQELKAEFLATPKDEYVIFKFQKETEQIPSYNDQKRAIKFLNSENAIKTINEKYFPPVDKYGANLLGLEPMGVSLDILQPQFDKIYKEVENNNHNKEFKSLGERTFPYIKDEELYSLWMYANAEKLLGKKLLSLEDLIPLNANGIFSIYSFVERLKEFGIELEKITFNIDIFKQFCKQDFEEIKYFIEQNPKEEISISISKLFKNNATFKDILNICQPFNKLKRKESILGFIEFSSTPSDKNIKPLKDFLDFYIQFFLEDNLYSLNSENFYRFSRQKEIFLYQIKQYVQDYGSGFIFKHSKTIAVSRGQIVSIGEDPAFLFLHTLIALEKMGLFKVERIFIVDMDLPPEKNTDDYKIKISEAGKLLKEYEKSDSKTELKSIDSEQVNNNQSKTPNYTKNRIHFSPNYGLYLDKDKKEPSYPIKGKKRPKIITNLIDGKKDANILCDILKYNTLSQLSKEIKEINKNCRNMLKLDQDLIIRQKTGGYIFNDKYEITSD